MAYSYDRTTGTKTAGTKTRLLSLIVGKALEGRRLNALIDAFTEELEEEYEEDYDAPEDPMSPRYLKQIGVMLEPEAEKVARKLYIQAYKRGFPQASNPLETWEWPDHLPRKIPRKVAEAIGMAMGTRDARDAVALQGMARGHR